MEVRYDLNQVLEGQVHKDRYLHSLVNTGTVLLDMWWCSYLEGLPQESGGRTLADGSQSAQV